MKTQLPVLINRIVVAVLMLCLLLTGLTAAAETDSIEQAVTPYGVSLFSSGNGIPTGEANAVLQTEDGYVWVGGYGGLLRYDGLSFEQFSGEATGLTSFSIRSLWQDDAGRLWVGTNEQGAFYYENGRFERPGAAGVVALSVRCFAEDDQGTVWIGAADGLSYIRDGQICPFNMEASGYPNSTVYTLSAADGLLWGVDNAGAVFAVDPEAMRVCRYFAPGTQWDSEVYAYSVLAASDGRIYIGTGTAMVWILDPSDGSILEALSTGGLAAINSICETEDGEIWFCGDKGIGRYADGVFFDLSYLENADHLLCIREDYEHNLWIASSKYGVLHVTQNKIRQLTATVEMDNIETYAVHMAGEHYYIGSERGLTVLNTDFSPVDNALTAALNGHPVHAICADAGGRVYIGTYYSGLYIFDPASGDITHCTLSGDRVRMLLLLSDGTVAAASNGGVDILRDGEIVHKYTDFKPTSMILCMAELPDGTLLAGSDGGGVYALSDDTVRSYATTENGLSGGVILRLSPDGDTGKVWISCGNDLFYGDATGFVKTAELSDGSGSILDIFPDGDTVWLFRSSGVLKLTRNALLLERTVEADAFFGETVGMPGTIVANSWSLFDGRRFIICTTGGIGLLDADTGRRNTVTPKAAVKAIKFNDGTVWDGGNTVELDAGVRKVSLSLAALTFGGGDTKVEYCLDGVDNGIITRLIRDQHEIEYTSIPAGTHVFRCRVFNVDNQPSAEIRITFIKKPKFTETVWFSVSVVLLAAAVAGIGVFLTVYFRMRRMRSKQHVYKQITDQAIATIAGAIDAKDRYTNGHSRRVADFSVRLARRMGLSETACEQLYYIGLLHDIGKIGIPDDILKKNGKLTAEEYDVIKQHPKIGGDILANFTALPGVAEGARYHHEKYDGTGYCAKLNGEQIPLYARIIGVADAYDAMNSTRCYRSALTTDEILRELENGKGTQFDPHIAAVAIELIQEDRKKGLM